jgi:hypothetical protein
VHVTRCLTCQGYVPRNVENNKSFPINGARTYAFVHPARAPTLPAPLLSNQFGCPLCEVACTSAQVQLTFWIGSLFCGGCSVGLIVST